MSTTVRQFNGAGDRIVFSPGVLEVVGGDTPVTVMALVKLDADGWRTIVSFEAPGADERVGIQVSSGDGVLGLFTPFGSELLTDDDVAPPGEWLLVGMQRDGGEDQMIRVHVQYADGTWLHTDTAIRSDPGAIGPSGRIQVGEMSTFGEYLPGRLAVVGTWLGTMSDQAIEAAGLRAALRNWLDLGGGPASLLAFNQESENTPVVDVVAGSGVTQTSIVGTTVVDDQDLVFDFDLDNGDDHVTTADPLVLDLGFVAPAAAAALLASAEPLALTASIGTPEVTAAVSTTATPLALAIGGGDPETAADLRSGAAPLMLAVSAGRPATNADLRTTAAPLVLAVRLGPVHTGQPPELVPRVVWAVPAETRTTAVRGETRRVHVRA
ncbi:MAG UNVERIFIED_CONTAM: hypothetical protein LOD86_00135 [Thermobifida fusca]